MLAANYISELMAKGHYTFTVGEAAKSLGQSLVATRAALRRLGKKGEISMPYRGFWVIVPPEYRGIGCLPPDQFVPQLMEHLNEPYYAALLSAVVFHGASHHQPQIFQVMVAKNRPGIYCGKVRIRFIARKNVAEIPTLPFKTPRGYLKLSTPEATAFDLVGYPERSAGLDNVATILADLSEGLDGTKLVEAAKMSPVAWAQRLGYILELVEAEEAVAELASYIESKRPVLTPLIRSKSVRGAIKDQHWRVLINGVVEAEI